MRMLNKIDEQPAGKNTRAKNHHGRQDDFPVIHCAWSPWSTDARSVFSKFCERSSELAEVAGVKNVHAPHSIATATHETAARQSPCTHKSRFCGATRDASSALTRFSKAYGTRSSSTSVRATAINFFCSSARFILAPFFQTRLRRARLQS